MSDIVVDIEPSAVAVVTLDRPAKRNAVTLGMWRELASIFDRLGADREVRAVVLTGRGDHFSAGADISEFGASRRDATDAIAYERDVDHCTESLMKLPKPTIAAVTGYCLGGGCALAMACDFRVAHRSARFGIPAARLGTVYGVLDSRNLLNLVGLPRAKEILFSGGQFDATDALAIGFIDRLVDEAALDDARQFSARLAESAPLSIAAAKLILNAVADGDVDRKTDEIRGAMDRAGDSKDYQEGVRAFLEKRRPAFRGE